MLSFWKHCLPAALLLAALFHLPTRARGSEVRIVGPRPVEEIAVSLVEGYTEEQGLDADEFSLDYIRGVTVDWAATTLVRDGTLMLWWGRVDGSSISGRYKNQWEELSPEEHVIGAITPAFVVHARNPIDSLTTSQLESVFSGDVSAWRAIGGDEASIRCYSLPRNNEVVHLLHDKWEGMRGRFIVQKRDSRQVLDAVATDPGGIGIIDAAAEVPMGDSVKKLAVDGVLPNAQTVKDGTYPPVRRLVLYVPPDAQPEAKELVRFLLSDRANPILRRHSLLPALREEPTGAVTGFLRLYGAEIERVRSTPGSEDNIELAERMLHTVATMDLDHELIIAMCEAAYKLGFDADGGETIAFKALHALREKVPGKEYESARKRVALFERAYNTDRCSTEGRNLVDALLHAAETATASSRHEAAADLWSQAQEAGAEIGYARQEEIDQRLPAFKARVKSVRRARELAARLENDPENNEVRRELLKTYLVELDDPAGAEQLIRPADEEELKTNVPVAVQPAESLSRDAALRLAEWYVKLADEAGRGGRELMIARAMEYYSRFYSLHPDRSDALAMRAAMGVHKIGGNVPTPDETGRPERDVAELRLGEKVTDLRLAEMVARHPDMTRLEHVRIGGIGLISSLRPLTHLTGLTHVELRRAERIPDLSPLSALPNLRSLTLRGLKLDDFSPIAELSGLTALNLSYAENLSDLGPIGRLIGLQRLTLSGCPEISDLRPLEGLENLTRLTLSENEKIRDLTPLEELSDTLERIDLRDCTGISDIYPLSRIGSLSHADLRGCRNVAAADIEWLKRQLPECRIRHD